MSMMSTNLFDVPLGLLSNINVLLPMYSLSILWNPSQSFPHSSTSSSSLIFPAIVQLFIVPPLSSGLSAVPLLSLPTDSSSCSHSSTHNCHSRRKRGKKQKNVDPESWRASSAPLTFTHSTDRKRIFQRTDKSAAAFIWPIRLC